MREKRCRLSKADKWFMGGGGGGGSDIDMRKFKEELPDINLGYKNQFEQLGGFRSGDPFLSVAGPQALDWFQNRLPDMLAQFPEFGKEIQGYQSQLGGFLGAPGGAFETAASGGALSKQMGRDVSQQFRNLNEAGGNVRGVGSLGQELLNRDMYRQQRYNTALTQSSGGLQQMAGFTGQRANLLGQEQSLETGGLNQLLGVGQAGVSQFGALTNPILSYLSSLFGGNQQASIAQAQIGAQQDAASKAGTGSAIGGGISAIGSIAAIAL
jgi:hypothetical protein